MPALFSLSREKVNINTRAHFTLRRKVTNKSLCVGDSSSENISTQAILALATFIFAHPVYNFTFDHAWVFAIGANYLQTDIRQRLIKAALGIPHERL